MEGGAGAACTLGIEIQFFAPGGIVLGGFELTGEAMVATPKK